MQESPPGVTEVKLGQLDTSHIPVYSNTRGGPLSLPTLPVLWRIKLRFKEVTSLAEGHIAEWRLDAELSSTPRQCRLGNNKVGTHRPLAHVIVIPTGCLRITLDPIFQLFSKPFCFPQRPHGLPKQSPLPFSEATGCSPSAVPQKRSLNHSTNSLLLTGTTGWPGAPEVNQPRSLPSGQQSKVSVTHFKYEKNRSRARMDFKGEEQDSCPTLPLARVDAKFQIALCSKEH